MSGRARPWVSAAKWAFGGGAWLVTLFVIATPIDTQRTQAGAFAELVPDGESHEVGAAPALAWRGQPCDIAELGEEIGSPVRGGWQVLATRARCGGERGEGGAFWSAWLVQGLPPEGGGASPVASASLPAEVVERGIDEALPRLVNPAIREMMVRYSGELKDQAQDWKIPSWLLDDIRLGEDSRVEVSRVRAAIGTNNLRVSARLDVLLVFELGRFRVSLRERFEPVSLLFEARPGGELIVREATLRRQGCVVSNVPLLSRVFDLNRLCDEVLGRLHDRLESELQRVAHAQVREAIAGLELRPVLLQMLEPWARDLVEDARVVAWWEELGLSVGDVSLSRDGVSLIVESGARWAQATAAWPEAPSLGPEEGELRVSAPFLMSMVRAVMERPGSELVALAREVDGEGVSAQLARLNERIARSGFVRAEALDAGESVDAALALLGLAFDAHAVIRPRFWVEGPTTLGVGIEDLRALRMRERDSGLAFTAWGSVQWGEEAAGGLELRFSGDVSPALQVAARPFGYDALDARTQTRLRAQLRLLRETLAQVDAPATLPITLPDAPALELGGAPLTLESVEGDAASQTLRVRVRRGGVAPEQGRASPTGGARVRGSSRTPLRVVGGREPNPDE